MRKLLVQPQACVDLLEIWQYIAADNPQAADRVVDKLEQSIRSLIEMPGKGHTRPDVKDGRYRFWSVYSYVIAYRYDRTSLTIVRVVHGRRNFRRLFR
jgi:plasmid stabilization system protein ParE